MNIKEIIRDIKLAEEHWNKAVELGWKGAWKKNPPEAIEEMNKGYEIMRKYAELCNYPLGHPEGDEIIDYLRVIIKWEEMKDD